MKKGMKIVVLVLAVLMVFSVASTAFAADLRGEWTSWPNIYTGRRTTGYIFVMQRFLYDFNHTARAKLGSIDGAWGGKTESSLKYFQGTQGLKQDAQCGSGTWGKMNDNLLSARLSGGYIFMSNGDACCQNEICRKRSDGTWWTNHNSYRFR